MIRRLKNDRRPHEPLSSTQRTALETFLEKCRLGRYSFEANACLCGSNPAQELTVAKKDRYGIPLTTRLCRACGLLRSDPYLDESSLSRFYAEDYHALYLADFGLPAWFRDGVVRGETALRWLAQEGFADFTRVFDVGCGAGGFLYAVSASGREAVGCDSAPSVVNFARSRGLRVVNAPPAALKAYGPADLLIISHVLEHFRNPIAHLQALKDLLSARGLVYVEVPGILHMHRTYGDVLSYLQNAHVWHFCLDSLDYVMSHAGFTRCAGTEEIKALYRLNTAMEPLPPDDTLHKRVLLALAASEADRRQKWRAEHMARWRSTAYRFATWPMRRVHRAVTTLTRRSHDD